MNASEGSRLRLMGARRRSPPVKSRLPRLTDRLSVGEARLKVSPVCLGMVAEPDVIPAAFDAGVNFFFLTADMHWPLYEPARRGLERLLARGGGIRDRIVVAATCYVTQPEFCSAPFREVLEAVPRLTRLDVVSAGGAYGRDFQARLPVFQEHRRSAFCGARAIGASFHERSAAAIAIAQGLVDVAFIRYNAAHVGARKDLFPAVPAGRRTRVFNFKSTAAFVPSGRRKGLAVAAGKWRPDVTDHYRFALTRPEIDGILCSLASPEQVQALADALARGPLSTDEERALVRFAKEQG